VVVYRVFAARTGSDVTPATMADAARVPFFMKSLREVDLASDDPG